MAHSQRAHRNTGQQRQQHITIAAFRAVPRELKTENFFFKMVLDI
jgi:hypothetical protein